MHQNRGCVLGDPQQGPDRFFGKMGNIVFCVFSLFTLIINVIIQFSEKVRISPEVPRGETWTVSHLFSIAFCCKPARTRSNAQKWESVRKLFPEVKNWPHLPENVFLWILHNFYKRGHRCVWWRCTIFLSFLQKCILFFRGGPRGKFIQLYKILKQYVL